jgi:hypothetical protein
VIPEFFFFIQLTIFMIYGPICFSLIFMTADTPSGRQGLKRDRSHNMMVIFNPLMNLSDRRNGRLSGASVRHCGASIGRDGPILEGVPNGDHAQAIAFMTSRLFELWGACVILRDLSAAPHGWWDPTRERCSFTAAGNQGGRRLICPP